MVLWTHYNLINVEAGITDDGGGIRGWHQITIDVEAEQCCLVVKGGKSPFGPINRNHDLFAPPYSVND